MKVSDKQRAILQFLADGHAPALNYYNGPPGAEGSRHHGCGFFWQRYDRTKTAPEVPGQSVNGLVHRGFMEYVGDGDYKITEKGRAALSTD